MAKEDSVNWSDLKKVLQDAEKNELIDLIRDLYKRFGRRPQVHHCQIHWSSVE